MSSLVVFFFIVVRFFTSSYGADFNVVNQCKYTVWAAWATTTVGSGQRLDPGQTWSPKIEVGTTKARIWGRTNCKFDANGQGQCDSGNCNGGLNCQGYGTPPNTLAEFTLNQANNLDYVDISLIDGFNIPMDFSPTTNVCRRLQCAVDINSQCPAKLKATGGCNNPCTVFKTVEYCCTIERGSCGPTNYSQFFKKLCPDAYSYPQDDPTSLFTCPSGTNYKVTFCP